MNNNIGRTWQGAVGSPILDNAMKLEIQYRYFPAQTKQNQGSQDRDHDLNTRPVEYEVRVLLEKGSLLGHSPLLRIRMLCSFETSGQAFVNRSVTSQKEGILIEFCVVVRNRTYIPQSSIQ